MRYTRHTTVHRSRTHPVPRVGHPLVVAHADAVLAAEQAHAVAAAIEGAIRAAIAGCSPHDVRDALNRAARAGVTDVRDCERARQRAHDAMLPHRAP